MKEAQALLCPAAAFDLGRLPRAFMLRTSKGFVENDGARVRCPAAQALSCATP